MPSISTSEAGGVVLLQVAKIRRCSASSPRGDELKLQAVRADARTSTPAALERQRLVAVVKGEDITSSFEETGRRRVRRDEAPDPASVTGWCPCR